jgi:hypothetical protein
MNSEFQKYNDASVEAFAGLIRNTELVARKTENFLNILRTDTNVKSVLHLGYGPVALGLSDAGYDVTLADSSVQAFNVYDENKVYDAIIAPDEYFTFAQSEEHQNNLVHELSNKTRSLLITTLSDYKNMADNQKEFGDSQSYKTEAGTVMYMEKHTKTGRLAFSTKVYKIDQDDKLRVFGPSQRRQMFFKQLARLTQDLHALDFTFQKNMLYKGMTKKNYEHIITIKY